MKTKNLNENVREYTLFHSFIYNSPRKERIFLGYKKRAQ